MKGKKIISFISALVLAGASSDTFTDGNSYFSSVSADETGSESAAEINYLTGLKGDVNLDGTVDQLDATVILNELLSLEVNGTSVLADRIENAAGDESVNLSRFLGDVDFSSLGDEFDQMDATAVLRALLKADMAGEKTVSDSVWKEVNEGSSSVYKDDIFSEYYEQASRTMKMMTVGEKVSQIFLAGYPGYNAAVSQASGELAPAGYVLFAVDFENQTKDSVRTQLNTLKSKSEYGLLLGADEEGGTVVRVSKFSAFRAYRFLSPQNLYNQGGMELIKSDAAEKANLLRDIGLNYNLAPVVDMPRNSSSYIYDRSLGQNADITSEFAAAVTNVMNTKNMMACLKHFPGYGDNLDTHSLVSVDTRTRETFDSEDLRPFTSGIKAGVPMVMVNHNIINCMDGTKPASLSEEVHRVLREDLDFSGLIMTDSLSMGAVKKYAENGESAVQAVLSGNDVIVTQDYLEQRNEVFKAVSDGRIPEKTIDNAVRRILACKYSYGVLK